jgi:hypothetical protein
MQDPGVGTILMRHAQTIACILGEIIYEAKDRILGTWVSGLQDGISKVEVTTIRMVF